MDTGRVAGSDVGTSVSSGEEKKNQNQKPTTKNRPGYVEKIAGSLDFLRFCYGIDSIYNVW